VNFNKLNLGILMLQAQEPKVVGVGDVMLKDLAHAFQDGICPSLL
jgi:hypothetical protein